MAAPFGNQNAVGNKGGGRKGFALEGAKKHLLKQAYWIVNKKLEKMAADLTEKEKIELAKQIVLKELGSNIDLTSDGDKLQPLLVKFINEKDDTKDNDNTE